MLRFLGFISIILLCSGTVHAENFSRYSKAQLAEILSDSVGRMAVPIHGSAGHGDADWYDQDRRLFRCKTNGTENHYSVYEVGEISYSSGSVETIDVKGKPRKSDNVFQAIFANTDINVYLRPIHFRTQSIQTCEGSGGYIRGVEIITFERGVNPSYDLGTNWFSKRILLAPSYGSSVSEIENVIHEISSRRWTE